ncbi:hypothetical protein DOY81_006197 [Sarcophaga bullata]|nr:hypothetical protein DOY81_006197 [Sarcophaga bullata]
MYRSSPEVKKPTEPFKSFLGGLNGMDVKCYQDMYLETCASLDSGSGGSASSPSISPSSSISTTTSGTESISPDFMSSPNTTIIPGSSYGGGMMNVIRGNHTDIQQQQFFAYHQQHQHQLAAPTVVPNHFAMAIDPGSNYPANFGAYTQQQQDEISKSLKMFAMLSGYPHESEPFLSMPPQMPQSPVDEVMQDFACNGYAIDELNRYQLGMHLSNNPALTPTGLNTSPFNSAKSQQRNAANAIIVTSPSAADAATATLNQQQQNLNNNFWKALPTHLQQQQQQQNTQTVNPATAATDTATAAVTASIDYNSNQKKPKRYHSSKEKYATKHCVFCENNNEAEAVVKSHSVRDTLGRVLCPKLRTYVCPICKASGDLAHTVKYCPKKPIITMEDALKGESFRLTKGTYYKQQMKV